MNTSLVTKSRLVKDLLRDIFYRQVTILTTKVLSSRVQIRWNIVQIIYCENERADVSYNEWIILSKDVWMLGIDKDLFCIFFDTLPQVLNAHTATLPENTQYLFDVLFDMQEPPPPPPTHTHTHTHTHLHDIHIRIYTHVYTRKSICVHIHVYISALYMIS